LTFTDEMQYQLHLLTDLSEVLKNNEAF